MSPASLVEVQKPNLTDDESRYAARGGLLWTHPLLPRQFLETNLLHRLKT